MLVLRSVVGVAALSVTAVIGLGLNRGTGTKGGLDNRPREPERVAPVAIGPEIGETFDDEPPPSGKGRGSAGNTEKRGRALFEAMANRNKYNLYGYLGDSELSKNQPGWVNAIFPALPAASLAKLGQEPVSTWPAESRALAASLLRGEELRVLKGGLDIRRTVDQLDPRWGHVVKRATQRELVPHPFLILGYNRFNFVRA